MDEGILRESLVALLTKGNAHVAVAKALEGVPVEARGRRPAEGLHSVWEELEHMRLAQEDILRYTLDASWVSPEWPQGYWPGDPAPRDAQAWEDSVKRFHAELEEVCDLVRDPARDLTARIPHGQGRTYLRQVLLVADHNAYHLGQLVQTRKLVGAWSGD
jgi:uncharacterized damage-inducible protein DinB